MRMVGNKCFGGTIIPDFLVLRESGIQRTYLCVSLVLGARGGTLRVFVGLTDHMDASLTHIILVPPTYQSNN